MSYSISISSNGKEQKKGIRLFIQSSDLICYKNGVKRWSARISAHSEVSVFYKIDLHIISITHLFNPISFCYVSEL